MDVKLFTFYCFLTLSPFLLSEESESGYERYEIKIELE